MYAYARVPSPPRPPHSLTYTRTDTHTDAYARQARTPAHASAGVSAPDAPGCVRAWLRACVHACTCRHGTARACVYVLAARAQHASACTERTRVRYVFSNSESQAGSSNLHIYSFTVIQSSLKLARTRVSARPPRQCMGAHTPRAHPLFITLRRA